MEFMQWIVYPCMPPGFIKENVCVKMLDKKFLSLTLFSFTTCDVTGVSDIYLGDLSCMLTENVQK